MISDDNVFVYEVSIGFSLNLFNSGEEYLNFGLNESDKIDISYQTYVDSRKPF